jgi:large subunit ribosomal protein L4
VQVPVYNIAGEVVDNIEISEGVFGVPFNESVVHQAMVRQRANARQGTSSTKTRGEVSGSTRKLYKQKGTGNARAGSSKSPLRYGGGIVFGPKPRDYSKAMPKKMRQMALRCILSEKARGNELVVLDKLSLEEPKTREIAGMLKSLGIDSPALIVTLEQEDNEIKSARNIPVVKTMSASLLNVVDLLSSRKLLMTVTAVRKAEELWGEKESEGGNGASL